MKATIKVKKIFLGIILFIAILLGVQVNIQNVQAAEEIPDYRLQISPTTLDFELEPGKTSSDTFKVINNGKKGYDFVVGVSPFTVKSENYDPDFETVTEYNSIVDWVSFSQTDGHVEPDEAQEITVTITVPDDIPAGGQYALIYVELVRPETESTSDEITAGATVQQRVGIKIYSEVEGGNARREGRVLETKIPTFIFDPPITATSLVENTGNVHATATYTLQVFPLFGDEEVYTNAENPATLTILPETQRFNSISWDGAPQLGIFRVRETVSILDDTQTIEKIVFLCPIWFLFLVLLIIFFAIFWLVSRVRSRHQAAKHTVKPAEPKE